MTREEAIKAIELNRLTSGYTMLCEALDMAIDALREQEERENVWHDAKDNPPQKPGLYYGKKDDTDSMYLCQYRDGVWTLDAYPEIRMHVIKWAYYNAFVQEQEERRWIPVTEKLPAFGERVICTDGHAAFEQYRAELSCVYGMWDRFGVKSPMQEVTHWMPMPEPPKGE